MLLSDGQPWKVHPGDTIPHMLEEMPPRSVSLAITSVPFPSMYAYTHDEADIGNSEEVQTEARLHLGFFFAGLRRVLQPGRAAVVHCMQIPRMKRSGGQGLFDFRGLLIRLGQRAGLVYDYDWHVRKNPQSQAIRTRSHQLQFAGLERDRVNSRGALGDYLIKFLAPGDNDCPVNEVGEVSRNDWIDWAEGSWDDIQETDTLNVEAARAEGDTKHICPLQLEVIRRLILLYSNRGEIVFDPFAGIYSVGYCALGGVSRVTRKRIHEPRRFYGCEIKESYRLQGAKYLDLAMRQHKDSQKTLFDLAGIDP